MRPGFTLAAGENRLLGQTGNPEVQVPKTGHEKPADTVTEPADITSVVNRDIAEADKAINQAANLEAQLKALEIKPEQKEMSGEQIFARLKQDTAEVLSGRIEYARKGVENAQNEYNRGSWGKRFDSTFKFGGLFGKTVNSSNADALNQQTGVLEKLLQIQSGLSELNSAGTLDRLKSVRRDLGLPEIPVDMAGDYDKFTKAAVAAHQSRDKSLEVDWAEINRQLAESGKVLDIWETVINTVDTGASIAAGFIPGGAETYALAHSLTDIATGMKTPKEALTEAGFTVMMAHVGGRVMQGKMGASITKKISEWAEKNAVKFASNPKLAAHLGSAVAGAGSGATGGVLIGGGTAVVKETSNVITGKKTAIEGLKDAAKETAKSAVMGAGMGAIGGATGLNQKLHEKFKNDKTYQGLNKYLYGQKPEAAQVKKPEKHSERATKRLSIEEMQLLEKPGTPVDLPEFWHPPSAGSAYEIEGQTYNLRRSNRLNEPGETLRLTPAEESNYRNLLLNSLIEQKNAAKILGVPREKMSHSLELNYRTEKNWGLMENAQDVVYMQQLQKHVKALRSRGCTDQEIITELAGHIYHEHAHENTSLAAEFSGPKFRGDTVEVFSITSQLAYYTGVDYFGPSSYGRAEYARGLQMISGGKGSLRDHEFGTVVGYELLRGRLIEHFPEYANEINGKDAISAIRAIRSRIPPEHSQKLQTALRESIQDSNDISKINKIKSIVLKNYLKSNNVDDTQRIQIAENILDKSLTVQQKEALLKAHNLPGAIDEGDVGKNTFKGLTLMRDGIFTRKQAQMLMDAGLAGSGVAAPAAKPRGLDPDLLKSLRNQDFYKRAETLEQMMKAPGADKPEIMKSAWNEKEYCRPALEVAMESMGKADPDGCAVAIQKLVEQDSHDCQAVADAWVRIMRDKSRTVSVDQAETYFRAVQSNQRSGVAGVLLGRGPNFPGIRDSQVIKRKQALHPLEHIESLDFEGRTNMLRENFSKAEGAAGKAQEIARAWDSGKLGASNLKDNAVTAALKQVVDAAPPAQTRDIALALLRENPPVYEPAYALANMLYYKKGGYVTGDEVNACYRAWQTGNTSAFQKILEAKT